MWASAKDFLHSQQRSRVKYFFYKLIPPRPTFPSDITEAEGKVMQEHTAYWKGLVDSGVVVVVGPVADPKGVYGLAIIEAESEEAVAQIKANDPVMKGVAGFVVEIHPMIEAMLRK